jgi:hypothetical protein
VHASSELALDPLTRLARVAADQEAERTIRVASARIGRAHRPDQGGAQARDSFVIERVLAGLTADPVSAEQMRHTWL